MQISREPSPKLADASAWSPAMNEFVTQARSCAGERDPSAQPHLRERDVD
jgi:hypothetical protein